MKCSDVNELLSAHANGELHRTQREFVEEHVAGCADCRADLADYGWVRRRLSPLMATPVGADIGADTMSRVRRMGAAKRPSRRLMRPSLIAATLVAAIMVLLAVQLLGPSPATRITEAYVATADLQSFRMVGTTRSAAVGETSDVAFEWEFAAPDRYRGTMTTGDELQEFIIIGDEQYSRDSNSGRSYTTIVVMSDSIFSPMPSRDGALKLLDSLIDVEELPDQKIDGADSRYLRGRVDFDRFFDEQAAGLDPESEGYQQMMAALELQRTIRIDVELWLSKEDHSIRQMKLDGSSPMIGSGSDGFQQVGTMSFNTVVSYYDFNEPVEIEPPLAASGGLEPGWRQAGSGQ